MTTNASENPIKASCPQCEAPRWSDVKGVYETSYSEEYVSGTDVYRILECRGCNERFFSICSDNSEDVDHEYVDDGRDFITIPIYKYRYFPKTNSERPLWLSQLEAQHEELAKLIEEIYVAFDNAIYVCAAIAIRTTFEMVTDILGINEERFVQKLDKLRTLNHINGDERDRLDCLVEAGHASAHRAWKPNKNDMRTLLSIMDSFIHRTIILPEEARQLRTRIPPRRSSS